MANNFKTPTKWEVNSLSLISAVFSHSDYRIIALEVKDHNGVIEHKYMLLK